MTRSQMPLIRKRQSDDEGIDIEDEPVATIASLLKATNHASIDRERLELVKSFIEKDSDELRYLPQKVQSLPSPIKPKSRISLPNLTTFLLNSTWL